MEQKMFTTKDFIMLGITLGGMIVSVTAWGYSLKGSIDLNKQAVEQLTLAQQQANANVEKLAVRQNDTEKDVIGVQKDLENLQKKTLSYNTGSTNHKVAQAGPLKIENNVKNEKPKEAQISAPKENEQPEEEDNAVERLVDRLGL